MPKKQTLTMAELKALLLARFNAEQSKQAKLQARLQQELGNEAREEEPADIAIRNKLADWISDLLAHRLKQNRRATPLISSRDLVKCIPLMINLTEEIEGDKLEAEKRKLFEKVMKVMLENASEMVHAMVSLRKNPYEDYWRWVTIVLDLAAEHGILPTELLALENATDEITRRMFSEKQFVALSKRATNKFMDANLLKKMIVQPLLETLVDELGEDKRQVLKQELEAKFMPQLREVVKKSKVVVNAWLGEEVKRIYAAA